MRDTGVQIDQANGIKIGDRVRFKAGGWNQYGTVTEIYLSFKYPRGWAFWRQPTIKVTVMFVIRDRHQNRHCLEQSRVTKHEGKQHGRR